MSPPVERFGNGGERVQETWSPGSHRRPFARLVVMGLRAGCSQPARGELPIVCPVLCFVYRRGRRQGRRRHILEQITRLTRQRLADRIERRETDRACLSRFQDRQI